MRTIYILIALFIAANIYSQQWQIIGYVNNPGPEPSICVANDLVVWIAGGNADTSRLFRSINGGLNWQVIPTVGINKHLNTVWGFNADVAFIGEGIVGGNAKLYRTSNGGVNWTVKLETPGNGGFFTGLAFTKGMGNTYGYAMATRIYRSTNSGNNWFEVNAGANGVSNAHNSLVIVDNNFYGFGLENGAARVRLTTDNATSWITHSVNIAGNYTSGIAFHSNKMLGLASTSSSMPIVARTSNGGLTWQQVNIGAGLTGTTYLNWIPWTSLVYILGQNGKVKRSLDHGVTWGNVQMPPTVTNVKHFDFINMGGIVYGYAIAGNGAVLKIVDSVLLITGGVKENKLPSDFSLKQNYPNPFNPVTTIDYALPYDSDVKIVIYDMMGRVVNTVIDQKMDAGYHSVDFDASKISSGIYYYKLITKDYSETKKMVLVK